MSTDFSSLPADLPVPVDDGAADHLPGPRVPNVVLPSTLGGELDLAQAASERLVVYVYPRTGTPGDEHIAYPLLSDHELALAEAMGLPTFEAGGLTLYKRLTFVAEECRIVKVFYPVFPSDRNAEDVLAWLQARAT